MLAYAAQGLPTDHGSSTGSQLRDFLGRSRAALNGLGTVLTTLIEQEALTPAEHYDAFARVLDADARSALAAIDLVLAQPAISSQLVDNLNASIHLRALLTDLFLIDEVLKASKVESANVVEGSTKNEEVG
ncbi:MAG: hypothetical protein HY654_10605 [Acidobacteria bacterium]|nr:hypothetical protein [Acidobacteriota bacterium]